VVNNSLSYVSVCAWQHQVPFQQRAALLERFQVSLRLGGRGGLRDDARHRGDEQLPHLVGGGGPLDHHVIVGQLRRKDVEVGVVCGRMWRTQARKQAGAKESTQLQPATRMRTHPYNQRTLPASMPHAMLVMQDSAATRTPRWRAAMTSGTVDMPTASAPAAWVSGRRLVVDIGGLVHQVSAET
jgi:hypothetical protein